MREIPKSCIMQRWLKMDNNLLESSSKQMVQTEERNVWTGDLMSRCKEMTNFATHTKQGYMEARSTIDQLTMRVKNMWTNMGMSQSRKRHGVGDPKVVETKVSKPAGNHKQPNKRCSNCRYKHIIHTI